jgi:hypothetical protein
MRFGAFSQAAIRRDEGDRIGRIRSDLDEHVITAADSMEHRHVTGDSGWHAIASLSLQNDDNGYREAAGPRRGGDLIHECSGRCGAVPPPAGWARSDDVRGIDEKHLSSLIASSNDGGR